MKHLFTLTFLLVSILPLISANFSARKKVEYKIMVSAENCKNGLEIHGMRVHVQKNSRNGIELKAQGLTDKDGLLLLQFSCVPGEEYEVVFEYEAEKHFETISIGPTSEVLKFRQVYCPEPEFEILEVTTKNLRLRSGPSLIQTEIKKLGNGTKMSILEEEVDVVISEKHTDETITLIHDRWIKVSDEQSSGWIFGHYTDKSYNNKLVNHPIQGLRLRTLQDLKLREYPCLDKDFCEVQGTVPAETDLTIVKAEYIEGKYQFYFFKVEYQGEEYWISGGPKYIEILWPGVARYSVDPKR